MAETKNLYLSKINLGGKDYLLKDAELRQTVYDLQAAGLEIKVEKTISGLNAKDYRGKLVLVAEEGSETGTYVEYVAVNVGGAEGPESWQFERIGTTAADLTDYVMKTATVAGLALDANISVEALQGALKLGALAYKAEATGEVAEQNITGIKATGDINGSATITYDDAASAKVTTKKVAGPIITKTKESKTVANVTDTKVNMTKNTSTGAIQIEGKVAAPELTVTPETVNVSTMFTANTPASWKAEPFTAATLVNTDVQFAKEGMKASVAENSEVLKIENVLMANAMDGLTFTGGAFDKSQLNLGTAASIDGVVATGIQTATASAPAFTGEKYDLALNSNGITVTAEPEYAAAQIDAVDTVVYSKANASATVAANGVSLNVGDIKVDKKTVTVK